MNPGVGSVLDDVATLVLDLRFLPITTEDEEGSTRLYLPARTDFGLVIMTEWDTVWVAPLLTAENIPGDDFETLWKAARQGAVSWLYALDPIPGYLDEDSLAALYAPTVLAIELLDMLGCHVIHSVPEGDVADRLLSSIQSATP